MRWYCEWVFWQELGEITSYRDRDDKPALQDVLMPLVGRKTPLILAFPPFFSEDARFRGCDSRHIWSAQEEL